MPSILTKKLNIQNDDALSIIDIINKNNGTARLIGGVVRDSLLNLSCKDIDIATDLLPENVLNIFTQAGYKTIPTGIKFGTVTVIVKGSPYEITTIRRDLTTDGRHAIVDFTDSYEEDAARRDFTINALSYDPVAEKIYDYFGGLEDLENKRVRFIGDPDKRIEEDYLRILRFFRFSAYYAKELDKDGIDACRRHAASIEKLSKERVKGEMDRLIVSRKASALFKMLIEQKIWQYIFGCSDFAVELLDHAWKAADEIAVHLIEASIYALMMFDDKPTMDDLIALRFSRHQAKMIENLYKFTSQLADKEGKINIVLTEKWLKAENWQQYFVFARILGEESVKNNSLALYEKLSILQERPTFPVKSESLLELGLYGKEIGEMQKKLRCAWIESEFSLGKQELITKAKEWR